MKSSEPVPLPLPPSTLRLGSLRLGAVQITIRHQPGPGRLLLDTDRLPTTAEADPTQGYAVPLGTLVSLDSLLVREPVSLPPLLASAVAFAAAKGLLGDDAPPPPSGADPGADPELTLAVALALDDVAEDHGLAVDARRTCASHRCWTAACRPQHPEADSAAAATPEPGRVYEEFTTAAKAVAHVIRHPQRPSAALAICYGCGRSWETQHTDGNPDEAFAASVALAAGRVELHARTCRQLP